MPTGPHRPSDTFTLRVRQLWERKRSATPFAVNRFVFGLGHGCGRGAECLTFSLFAKRVLQLSNHLVNLSLLVLDLEPVGQVSEILKCHVIVPPVRNRLSLAKPENTIRAAPNQNRAVLVEAD